MSAPLVRDDVTRDLRAHETLSVLTTTSILALAAAFRFLFVCSVLLTE